MTRLPFSKYRRFLNGLPGMLRIGVWDEETYQRVTAAPSTTWSDLALGADVQRVPVAASGSTRSGTGLSDRIELSYDEVRINEETARWPSSHQMRGMDGWRLEQSGFHIAQAPAQRASLSGRP